MMKPKFWYWSSSRTNDYHSITQIVMTPKLPSIIFTPKTHRKNNVWKRKMFVQPLAFACAGGLMRKMCWTFCTSYYTLITQTTPGPTSAFYHSFFSSEFTWKHKFTHVDARCHVVRILLSGIAPYVDIYVRYIFWSYPYMIHCFSCRWWNVKVWHELDANVTHSSHNNTATTEFECTHYIGSGNNN